MATGTIKSYDPDDQNGYIEPDEGNDDIPFDRDALVDFHQGDEIRAGERVTYEVEGGLAGHMATDVRRAGPRGYQ